MCQYLNIWAPVHPHFVEDILCKAFFRKLQNTSGMDSGYLPLKYHQKEQPSLTSVLDFLLQAKGPVCVDGCSPGRQTKSQCHTKETHQQLQKLK